MATMTEEKAGVTICKGEWDYFAGIYDLADLSEESALSVALEAIRASLDEMKDLHCVWVEVPGEYADRKRAWRFEREELKGE
jgi:hypothetical protein